jgi:hypothetical protein
VALASKALSNFCRAKLAPHTMPQSVAEYSKKVVDYLKIVDEKQRINEYTWLIRGFFEIVLGSRPASAACPVCLPPVLSLLLYVL